MLNGARGDIWVCCGWYWLAGAKFGCDCCVRLIFWKAVPNAFDGVPGIAGA